MKLDAIMSGQLGKVLFEGLPHYESGNIFRTTAKLVRPARPSELTFAFKEGSTQVFRGSFRDAVNAASDLNHSVFAWSAVVDGKRSGEFVIGKLAQHNLGETNIHGPGAYEVARSNPLLRAVVHPEGIQVFPKVSMA